MTTADKPLMITLDKPEGITPIDFWKQYRSQHFDSKTKGGICGKLDPMASGKLLILLDEECKKMPMYLKMEKTYTFDIIVGISTDTDDILGLLNPIAVDMNSQTVDKVIKALNDYRSTTTQKFHEFSAIWVEGKTDAGIVKKPMWWWSKNGLLDRIKVPEKGVKISELTIGKVEKIGFSEFVINSLDRLDKVTIDADKFRLKPIIEKWTSVATTSRTCTSVRNTDCPTELTRISVTAKVSTGTYVRQIVRDVSKEIGIPLLCDKIRRTELFFSTFTSKVG